MADGSDPGAGDVPITLGDKSLILVPSLDACIKISRLAGGLSAAVQRCAALDFDTILAILMAGIGANPRMEKEIAELVFETGLIALHAKCIDFIHIVANGGRPPQDEEDGETDDPLANASAS
jgi:hypothetical protein